MPLIPIPQLDINDCNAEAILMCPACEHNYLHHTDITVFSRPHEDGAVTASVIRPDGSVWPNRGGMNPSSRRDALAIRFWCEGCDDHVELTIVQHKGQTCLQWRLAVLP